jgi:D-3-phosphoglycerate dehydrogenase
VVGFDPTITVESAWKLPGHIQRAGSLEDVLEQVDYLSLHVPYMKETHHLISKERLQLAKSSCHIVNFARGELVDSEAMRELYDSGARTVRS